MEGGCSGEREARGRRSEGVERLRMMPSHHHHLLLVASPSSSLPVVKGREGGHGGQGEPFQGAYLS